ncbi:MAG: sodium:alanine symporter family protein, partial [Verrucomicrobia bacterium]|nr:sodium:alanine symporter family protein [Verrucomicrobiota bacterium]
AAQANQLASVLNSPVLGSFQVPVLYSAAGIVILVLLTLLGGVRRVGAFSAKLVPLMFILYVGSSSWIVLLNLDQLGSILHTIWNAVFSPYALASGSLVGGVVGALRWGVFKGIQSTEAGVGTQTIPHSLAETSDFQTQGVLAMLSTFSAGGLAFLSGLVALITNTWQDPTQSLGMGMVASSYQQYFSWFGVLVITVSALLFSFGTILGNAFNGSQCYGYLMQNKKNRYYFVLTALMIFLGAVGEVRTVWSAVDILLAFIAVPHMMALLLSVRRSPEMFSSKLDRLQEVRG